MNNTLMESHIDRMLDRGLDLVVVSSHRNPAPNCQPFEGQVLSIGEERPGTVERPNATGGAPVTVRVKATMDEARTQGFRHPNCRHSVAAFIPGASRTFTPEPDEDGYKATQQLRAMERAIRETKRRQAVAIEPNAKRALATKLRTQQSTLKQHVDANDLKRRALRERPDLGYRINPPDDLRGTTPKPAPVPPKPAPTLLSSSTRDLVDSARTSLPKTRSDWVDTTLRYPTDKNGAKLVPEKLQRHLDTTLNVGRTIRADAVKRIGTDSAIKALHAEEKKLVDNAQWLSPRRAEIQREIVRREQSIIREALNEVRPFGDVQQAARLKAVTDGRVSPGTQAALTQLRSAEQFSRLIGCVPLRRVVS
ncbi:phage minor capsid protein [Rhodococcoides fascians]|uniref:phage minor capsid protein n=1 Tax=Rhodococcoides fascians TaxID=1828 RepID=UPI00277D21EE|nr:phage minor capsid protein [Rhodococcus fascians]MDQ0281814.1 hypothetical protein [Rhodococcus fascians]